MYTLNDIRELANSVHFSLKAYEMKDIFEVTYSRTIKSFKKLQSERLKYLDACECALNTPRLGGPIVFSDYAKAYYEFLDNYNDLDFLVFQINSGK